LKHSELSLFVIFIETAQTIFIEGGENEEEKYQSKAAA